MKDIPYKASDAIGQNPAAALMYKAVFVPIARVLEISVQLAINASSL